MYDVERFKAVVDQDEIQRMARSEDAWERREATHKLRNNFQVLADRELAWEDLHRLTQDKEDWVRSYAVDTIGKVFSHIHNKHQAWEDLHRLTKDNVHVRRCVAEAIGSAFSLIPDKKQAWKDLNGLTKDEDVYVRWRLAEAIGSAFSLIPDKKQAWKDLNVLMKDEDIYVRISANNSAGRISIFRAGEAKSDDQFKKELETALEFFEIPSKETTAFNPSEFCLPFYRSFHAVTFRKENNEAEVKKYLAEAKSAVAGYKNREKLLEAVENLSNALKEAQKAKTLDEKKFELNAYRRYCDRACELLDSAEEKTPWAARAIRRGLPIIDERIKEILSEIEEKTKNLCRESRQTLFEKISRKAYDQIEGLSKEENPESAKIRLDRLKNILKSMCIILPEESKEIISNQLDEMPNKELPDKAEIITNTLIAIQPQIINLQKSLANKDQEIKYLRDILLQQLNSINFGVLHLKIQSIEIKDQVSSLYEIQNELKKLTNLEKDIKNIGINMTEMGKLMEQNHQRLIKDVAALCEEIEKSVIPKLPKNDETKMINEKLQELKQSRGEKWLGRAADLSSLIGFILQILEKLG